MRGRRPGTDIVPDLCVQAESTPRVPCQLSLLRNTAFKLGYALIREQMFVFVLPYLLERLEAETLGLSHQKLSVKPVNITCRRFVLSKLP